ncbi:MAG: hypothetical protein RLZZ292_1011 [Bacteroidota bacterium]|jgi:hypothetical protein
MKNLILSLLALCLSIAAFAQAPQSICYQAVAVDKSGTAIKDGKIELILTVLKGNATSGQVIYSEKHPQVTTDTYGLFTVQAGLGQATLGKFSDIDWGNGDFFLRVEMGLNGSPAQFIGSSQLLSVPYALYSQNSKRSATSAYADSAKVAKTAIIAQMAEMSMNDKDTDPTNEIQKLAFDPATGTIKLTDSKDPAGTAEIKISIPTSSLPKMVYDSVKHELKMVANNDPAGSNPVKINDKDTDPTNELQKLVFDPVNNTIKLDPPAPGGGTPIKIDDSSTNELQSLTIDQSGAIGLTGSNIKIRLDTAFRSTIPFSAFGASYDFPQGIVGEAMIINTNYKVPDGQTFYVTAGGYDYKFNSGIGGSKILNAVPGHPIFPEKTMIESCYCTGFMVSNKNSVVEPIIVDLTSGGYTVKQGYNLYIKSGLAGNDGNERALVIDGNVYFFYIGGNPLVTKSIVIPEGKSINRPVFVVGDMILTGYLIKNK